MDLSGTTWRTMGSFIREGMPGCQWEFLSRLSFPSSQPFSAHSQAVSQESSCSVQAYQSVIPWYVSCIWGMPLSKRMTVWQSATEKSAERRKQELLWLNGLTGRHLAALRSIRAHHLLPSSPSLWSHFLLSILTPYLSHILPGEHKFLLTAKKKKKQPPKTKYKSSTALWM